MTKYRRVTYEDRCQIYSLLQVNISVFDVSNETGFHRSTIYREIKRNKFHKYHPRHAQTLAKKRYFRCRRKFLINGELEKRVLKGFSKHWSPEQISGRIKWEQGNGISHQCIYHYVRRNWHDLKNYLRRFNRRGAGRCRQRKTKLTLNKRWISARPKVAESRTRIGDWERDTMYCAQRKLVLVCTDRKTRYTKIAKLKSYKIKPTSEITLQLLKKTKRNIHTITNDNGPEFRDGPNMPVPVYYCDPLKPNQRGTVENTIGLLRQYIKRTTNHRALPTKKLAKIESSINLRPRKCLDYLTPYEVFFGKRVALAT